MDDRSIKYLKPPKKPLAPSGLKRRGGEKSHPAVFIFPKFVLGGDGNRVRRQKEKKRVN